MLKGCDISRYQTPSTEYTVNNEFCIMKASEGVNYKDPNLDAHYDMVRGASDGKPATDKLYGFYHYARPDTGNTAQAEAEYFLSLVGHHVGNCLFVLDWEGKSLGYELWAKEWLDYVYTKTGVKPLLYVQQSQAKLSKYSDIANGDYGLWVARYDSNTATTTSRTDPGDIGPWKVWAMWQYAQSPYDKDYFNGTADQFRAYCKAQ